MSLPHSEDIRLRSRLRDVPTGRGRVYPLAVRELAGHLALTKVERDERVVLDSHCG
jgi:hypothetical protein